MFHKSIGNTNLIRPTLRKDDCTVEFRICLMPIQKMRVRKQTAQNNTTQHNITQHNHHITGTIAHVTT